MFSREVEAVKFEMKQGELNRRIEAYKTALAAGEFARASWPHLAAWLDTTEEALSQVLRDGPDTPRGRLLRKTATWLRGQILVLLPLPVPPMTAIFCPGRMCGTAPAIPTGRSRTPGRWKSK